MKTKSKIEWTERSDWNPVRGCTRHSEGCRNCYAERLAARFSGPGMPFEGFAERRGGEPRWTGKVEVMWDRLLLPLSWTKPAMIFANSTSDLFHEKLANDDIASIYAVAVAAHHLRGHTTQILTKRPDRARGLLNSPAFWELVNFRADELVMERIDPLNRRSDDARATIDDYGRYNPPPGVWLGTSVEDQRSRSRLLDLAATPAAVRFMSGEPLLEGVTLNDIPIGGLDEDGRQWLFDALTGEQYFRDDLGFNVTGDGPDMHPLNWVIAGGESGKGARPMHPDWARSLRDQCAAAGVPFFFKQWGEWWPHPSFDPVTIRQYNHQIRYVDITTGEQKRNPNRTTDQTMRRIGKTNSCRLLDGVEHNELPA